MDDLYQPYILKQKIVVDNSKSRRIDITDTGSTQREYHEQILSRVTSKLNDVLTRILMVEGKNLPKSTKKLENFTRLQLSVNLNPSVSVNINYDPHECYIILDGNYIVSSVVSTPSETKAFIAAIPTIIDAFTKAIKTNSAKYAEWDKLEADITKYLEDVRLSYAGL